MRQFELAHWLFVLGQNSQVAVTVFYREVLGLYRKREGARRLYEHGVFARFRYNGLKDAARDLRRTRALCKFNGGKERRHFPAL